MLSKYRVYCYDQLDSAVITAGSGAVLIGAQNGLFPDMGYAVAGEMGGLWAGEKKVADGFFFAIDDVPLVTADACEQSPAATAFHYRMQEEQLHIVRRQFIPDGVPGCVIELTVENLRARARMVEVSFTVRTDILSVAAAHGEDGLELGRDVGEYDEKTQAFYARDSRNPWHAVWGADADNRALQADLPAEVYGFGNTLGKGVNGRLFYRLRVAGGGQTTMRLFIAGGFSSRSKAEDMLAALRSGSAEMTAGKQERLEKAMEMSAAVMPDELLGRCYNWTKIYSDWLTRSLPGGGCALCTDLPEHPALYGEGWARAMGSLLPLGGAKKVQEMLRTLVKISEEAQLAPGRLARSVSLSGRVLQVGGPKESALFVALVHKTLLWSGDAQFAADMLPMTGLCMSYLRRATRSFDDVRPDIIDEVRLALAGQAYVLEMTGADGSECLLALEKLGPAPQPVLAADAPPEKAAAYHGRHGHVEQMIGCLQKMAKAGLPGLPGALRARDVEPGVLLASRAAAGFIWPMTEDLFGLRPDAGKKEIAFAPHTPIGWDGWSISRVRIGGADVDVKAERLSPSSVRYTLAANEPGWSVRACVSGEEKTLPVDGSVSLVMGD